MSSRWLPLLLLAACGNPESECGPKEGVVERVFDGVAVEVGTVDAVRETVGVPWVLVSEWLGLGVAVAVGSTVRVADSVLVGVPGTVFVGVRCSVRVGV